MSPKIPLILGIAFVTPIAAVLGLNMDVILEDMKPHPDNGYLIYVTTDT